MRVHPLGPQILPEPAGQQERVRGRGVTGRPVQLAAVHGDDAAAHLARSPGIHEDPSPVGRQRPGHRPRRAVRDQARGEGDGTEERAERVEDTDVVGVIREADAAAVGRPLDAALVAGPADAALDTDGVDAASGGCFPDLQGAAVVVAAHGAGGQIAAAGAESVIVDLCPMAVRMAKVYALPLTDLSRGGAVLLGDALRALQLQQPRPQGHQIRSRPGPGLTAAGGVLVGEHGP